MRSSSLLPFALIGLLSSACPPTVVGEGEGEDGEGGAEGEGEGEEGEGEEGEGDAGEGEGEGEGVYATDGPADVSVVSRSVDGRFDVDVYLSATPGPRPVVSLSPGLLQRAEAYVPFARRLASYGVNVVIRDDPGTFVGTDTVAGDIAFIVETWLVAENDDVTSPLFGRMDAARVGLSGHSRGGKASLLAASVELIDVVSGWVGLDPVDSSVLAGDRNGRDSIGDVAFPVLLLGAEVSSSCSPADVNHDVLFAAAATPTLHIVYLGAGHTQVQDPVSCIGCGFCTPAGSADPAVVLEMAVRHHTAFFARVLLDDASVGEELQGAGSAVDVASGRATLESKL